MTVKLGPGNYIEDIQVIDGPLLQFATMIEIARFAGIPFPPSEEIVMGAVIAGRRAFRFSTNLMRSAKRALGFSDSRKNDPEWGTDECCGAEYDVFIGGPEQ